MRKGVQRVLMAGMALLLLLVGACVESDVGEVRKEGHLLPVEIRTGVSPLQATTPVDIKSLPDTTRSEALTDSLALATKAGEVIYKKAIVLQYKGGLLVNGGSTDISNYTIGSSVSASLQAAEGCNIYVLAVNETGTTGGSDIFSTEEKLNGAAYDLYGLFPNPTDNDIPLAGSLKNVNVVQLSVGGTESGVIEQGSGETKVELSRIAAKLSLELLYSVPGYKAVAEALIKNVPSKMYYMAQPGDQFPAEEAAGAFTTVPFTLSDCDGDNNDQPATIFTRYLPANLRGTNAEVKLPREKYSGTAPKTATDRCTYVSFIAEEKKNTAHTLTYSFYLGGNTTSDFNIRRNYIYTINSTIAQTGEGDLRVSEEGISPELETDPLAQAVASANATLRATLATYGTPVAEYGFYYKKDTPFEEAAGATKTPATNLAEGAYTAVLNGLTPKTVYYFRSYAVFLGKPHYGALSSFSTNAEGVPVLTVEKAPASASSGLSASSSGNTVTGAGILSQGIIYSTTAGFNHLTAGVRVAGEPAMTSPFGVTVNDLTKGSIYYYRYFASNAQGYVYSAAESNFRTKDTPSKPTGGSLASTVADQLTFAATLPDRKNPVDDYPTTAGLKYWTADPGSDLSKGGSTLSFDAPAAAGAKSVNWTGMTGGQAYWYTFFSMNGAGTEYSMKQTFTSSAVLPAPNPSTREIGPQVINNAFTVTTARNTTATVSAGGVATIASGNGTASKSINMAAHTGAGSRTATLTFLTSGELPLRKNTMTITQGGVVFTPAVANVTNVPKGGQAAAAIGVSSNIPWLATSSQSWCTIGNGSQTGANTAAGDTKSFTYTVAKNEGIARTATVTVKGTGSFTGFSKVFTVSQLSGTVLDINRRDTVMGPQGGNHTLGITSNTSWTLASNNTDVATVGVASGENNKGVAVTVKAYTTLGNASSRTTTITAKPTESVEKSYKITQYGVVFPASYADVSNIVKGGQGAKSVSVLSNIPWEATSSAPDWCTITNGSQTGVNTKDGDTKSFTYTVKANTGIARSATITVKGTGSFAGISRTFKVSQVSGTELSINQTDQTTGPQATSHTLGITSNTSWTLESNKTDVATVGVASGENNKDVAVTVKAYTTVGNTSSRMATITVTPAGNTAKSYTITQYGVVFPASYADVSNIVKGGQVAKSVSVLSNIPWVATSDADWCTIANGSQTGVNTKDGDTKSFTYTVKANTGVARSATITVKGTGSFAGISRTFKVSQVSGTELSINQGNQTTGPQATSHTLGITSNTSWTLASNNGMATVGSASGSNTANVTVSVLANTATGSSRTATITATPTGNTAKSYTITQYGVAFSCTYGNVTGISKDGQGATSVSVSANIPWVATSDQSWCTISSGSQTGANTQTGDTKTFSYTVAANSGVARTATVTVQGTGSFTGFKKTFTVSQLTGTWLNINQTGVAIGPQATSHTLAVTSNTSWTLVSSNTNVATVSTASGSNNVNATVSVKDNTTSGSSRTTTVTATPTGNTAKSYTITQYGVAFSCTYGNVSDISKDGQTATNVSVLSNISWVATSNQSWCTISNGSQTGTNTQAGSTNSFSYTVSANNGGARSATITIKGTGNFGTSYVKTFTVAQKVGGNQGNLNPNDPNNNNQTNEFK